MLLAHAPAHIALAEGEQGYCLDACVPAECEAVAHRPVEEPCLLQVTGEGGPLMNGRRQGHAELPPQQVNVTVVARDLPWGNAVPASGKSADGGPPLPP
jgi:hypothetical protein